MRKLIFGMNLSIDGCCDHTAGIPDDEVLDYFTALNREADILLYGRKTYELMVPYWPEMVKNSSRKSRAENEFAQSFVSIPQMIVFSKTLSEVVGKNAKLIRHDLQGEIQKLKQQTGKNILTGGVSLPSQLLELGLIDEMRIVVHPIVAGKGRRLFDEVNLQEKLKLKLVDSKIFKSGCIAQRYILS